MARLLLIVPTERASEYETLIRSFANVPDCEVILDRRVAERRCCKAALAPSDERRRAERRSGNLDIPGTVVLFVH